MSFGGEGGLREVGLCGTHPLTRRYIKIEIGMKFEILFEDLEKSVISELAKAEKHVKVAVAWITFKNYEQLFIDLNNKGVDVEILVSDSPQLRKYNMTSVNKLIQQGIKVTICKMPSSRNYMHHKFAVIDDNVVLNGSFNWSENAARSFENLMIIRGDQEVVREFLAEFGKIKALDKKAIKSLQSTSKCKCGGRFVNLLVFDSTPMLMTYEMWADIISYCSSCDTEKTLKSGVQDTTLYSKFSGYEFVDDGSVTKLSIDRDIDEHYTGYTLSGHLIHGIGFVHTRYLHPNDEETVTTIRWKNKFVAQDIEDEYPTCFGVNYH
ncbi:hypothetical protein D8T49_24075 [Vibrio vulnificus]|uniref:phospholipase D-like domain-containing protein n=3 Tax=Vibrio vulnificus TaxID=672 RepID=UPI0010233A72|nr:hypothetical protein [Vibrio vulnificus]EGQ9240354.1 hypothetical protein [Vibrio vulnificus]EGQ9330282.1 hypothetical protein [Vibrio vulnificus]EGQ9784784.1 hypothetical protein [Vibrio vulnificus]EGR0089089.1 hypothetical protein [Vibrio vulnificus]